MFKIRHRNKKNFTFFNYAIRSSSCHVLINAHHAEIPGPETAAPECGDEYACRKVRTECKQVVSLAYFHTDGMDDGAKNACKNKCKNNVFAPKSRPAYAMSLMSPPPIALPEEK